MPDRRLIRTRSLRKVTETMSYKQQLLVKMLTSGRDGLLAAMDAIEESGFKGDSWFDFVCSKPKCRNQIDAGSVERWCVEAGLLEWSQCPNNARAIALQDAVFGVDLDDVPVVSEEAHDPPKERARMCRELFKTLGLKGISVTMETGTAYGTVTVKIPRPQHPYDYYRATKCCYKLGDILVRAWPAITDPLATDYWSFDT